MTRATRVLLVGPLPPPSGGMANQTRQLQRLLREDGIDVGLVQTNRAYRPAWVGSVPGLRAVFRLVPYLRELWVGCRGRPTVHVMANSGLAWYMLAAPAIAIAKRRGCHIIVNYRGGLAAEFLDRAASRVRAGLRDTVLVVPSPFLQEVFARHGVRAQVIPNIVDTAIFRPGLATGSGASQRPHVIVARNLEPIYGIDLALRAVELLRQRWPHLRCSIAGSGPEEANLRALTRDLSLDDCVSFTGRLEVAGMVQLYQSADVVLNPVRADNTPNSVLEALACGVPVVSTRVGGLPHLVQHWESAVLVEPESPLALADGVSQVLADDGLRSRLVSGGHALVANFTWARVRDQWLAAYAALPGSG
jgi:glycosyltransferase involved in cell wall biosynthesis